MDNFALPVQDIKTKSQLDLSRKELGVDDALMAAALIVLNGALETITFGDKQAVTMKTIMTAADVSGKELGAPGAIIVKAFLPKCQ